jgi:hypothetical protein
MGQPSRRNHESPGRILDRFKAHFGQDNVFMDSLHAGGQSPEARGAEQVGEDGPEKSSLSGLGGPYWTMTENGGIAEVLLDVGVPDGI